MEQPPAAAPRHHYVLCRPDKTPLHKSWQRSAPSEAAVKRHLAADGLLGIIPGKSGLLVVDVDVPPDADRIDEDALEALVAEHPPLASIPTPSGGRHLIYHRPPGAEPIGNAKWELGPLQGDIRCDRGFVVIWSPQGWQDILDADHAAAEALGIAQHPPDLLRPAAKAQPKTRAPRPAPAPGSRARSYADAVMTGLAATPEGDRNNALNAAAHSLGRLCAGEGLDPEYWRHRLLVEAGGMGLDESEIAPTVASGMAAGARSPKTLDPAPAQAVGPGGTQGQGKGKGKGKSKGKPISKGKGSAKAGQGKGTSNSVKPIIERDRDGLAVALAHLDIQWRYNQRSAKPETKTPTKPSWIALEDNDEEDIRHTIMHACRFKSNNAESQALGKADFGETAWRRATLALNAVKSVDPFLDHYLERLPPWDGQPRADRLLAAVFRLPPDYPAQLARWASRHITLGAVSRTLRPGAKLDATPVLIGGQGIGKSTLPRKLLPQPEWFCDSLDLADTAPRQVDAILGAVIVEIAEMSGATAARIEKIKVFMARTDDAIRLPYGRRKSTLPRRCIFVGTANEPNLPNDPTGNRRFVAVPVAPTPGGVKHLRSWIAASRDQLWAEALHRVRDLGEECWLTDDLQRLAAPINDRCRDRDHIAEETLATWLETRTAPFILQHAISGLNELLDPGADDSTSPPRDRYDYRRRGQASVRAALMHLGLAPPTDNHRIDGATRRWWHPRGCQCGTPHCTP